MQMRLQGTKAQGLPAGAGPRSSQSHGVPVALGAAFGCCIAIVLSVATERQETPPLHAHSPPLSVTALGGGLPGTSGSLARHLVQEALSPQAWALPISLADSAAIAPGTWLVGHLPAYTPRTFMRPGSWVQHSNLALVVHASETPACRPMSLPWASTGLRPCFVELLPVLCSLEVRACSPEEGHPGRP